MIFYFPDLAIARYFASSDFLSLLFLSVFCSCESISLLVLFPAVVVSLANAPISDRSKLLILTTGGNEQRDIPETLSGQTLLMSFSRLA